MKCNQTQNTNLNAPKDKDWGGWRRECLSRLTQQYV
jgi:hypothetical protein